jgi:hypothetical protein
MVIDSIYMTINKNRLNRFIYLLTFLLFLFYTVSTQAQETPKEKRWSFIPGVYINGPTLSGDVLINNNPAVLTKKKMNVGGMVSFEARSPKWSISTDFVYTNIGTDIIMPRTKREGTIDIRTSFYGLYGMRRVATWLEIGLGTRIVVYNIDMKVPAGIILSEIDANFKSAIVDPLIVTRFTFLDTDSWEMALRGDVGAFGLLGYFTYLIYPYVGYKIKNLFEVNLGYRVVNLYHDDEEGNDKIDLLYYGPQLGILIRL